MPCYRPIQCWKPAEDGPISFRELADSREIKIPCGQCIGCRIDKRDAWAVRCYAESKMHKANSFITLTYDDDHYPADGSLNYRDFQLFMKRLRDKVKLPLRFFMCGEYGDQTWRPHYHALIFGYDFSDDRRVSNSIYASRQVYDSELLSGCWGKGFVSIGDVTLESARYCAAYICKKRTGEGAEDYYTRVNPVTGEIAFLEPEFARMSLKPGIGFSWLEKYWPELYVSGHDCVHINGRRHKIPKFFDSKMDELAPLLMDSVAYERFRKANLEDNTRERLEVRETVAVGKARFTKERNCNNAL